MDETKIPPRKRRKHLGDEAALDLVRSVAGLKVLKAEGLLKGRRAPATYVAHWFGLEARTVRRESADRVARPQENPHSGQ